MGKSKNKKQQAKNGTGYTTAAFDSEKLRSLYIPLAIAAFTLVLFHPAHNHRFINWDDPVYITQNPLIQNLSVAGIIKIFSTPVMGMYNPVPFVIYAVLYNISGFNPVPYNWCGILFHLAAMVACYRFIYSLTGKYETAAIVAILFAVHPMHVEAVCWNSETKTPLFVIFYFVALSQYLKYIRSNYQTKYLVYITILFIISALCKPEAVTLPPMLLLVDYYLGRKRDTRLLVEKLPLFVIALFFGILTLYTHMQGGDDIFKVSRHYSLLSNLVVSNYSIAFYIEKLLFPVGLSAFYPYPESGGQIPVQYYVAVIAIPLIAWLVYKSGKFRNEMIFGVAFFVIAISILLRPVPTGFFETANRYSYLSYTGLFFIMGQFYVYVKENRFSYADDIKKYLPVILTCYIAFCVWRCSIRIDVWQNSVNLFTDVIAKQPGYALAYDMRSNARNQAGDNKGAIEDATRAIELDSTFVQAYNNRAAYRWIIKDYDGSMQDCDKALSLNPKSVEAFINRACLHSTRRQNKEALADLDTCLQIDPACALAYYNRALIKNALNDTAGAITDMKKADALGNQDAKKYLPVR